MDYISALPLLQALSQTSFHKAAVWQLLNVVTKEIFFNAKKRTKTYPSQFLLRGSAIKDSPLQWLFDPVLLLHQR